MFVLKEDVEMARMALADVRANLINKANERIEAIKICRTCGMHLRQAANAVDRALELCL